MPLLDRPHGGRAKCCTNRENLASVTNPSFEVYREAEKGVDIRNHKAPYPHVHAAEDLLSFPWDLVDSSCGAR